MRADFTCIILLIAIGVCGQQAPVAGFYASNDTICAGRTITFTDTSSNNPTILVWSSTGGITSNILASNPTYMFPDSGTFTITLNASNDYGGSFANQVIVVLSNPTVTVKAYPTNTFVCKHDMSTLSASGALTYTWNTFQNDSVIKVVLNTVSIITFSVVGTDHNGCRDSTSKSFRVVYCDFVQNVKEYSAGTSIGLVKPNPSNGMFYLHFSVESMISYSVTDFLGRTIISRQSIRIDSHTSEIPINLSEFPVGLYFLHTNSGGISKRIKLIKQ